MTQQRYVVQPLGLRAFGVLDTRTQLTVDLRFTRAAAEREANRLTTQTTTED